MKDANCAGKAPDKRQHPEEPDLWFPEKGESPNPGKIMCFTCPVRVQCKEYRDRTHTTDGMWGGEIKKKEGKE